MKTLHIVKTFLDDITLCGIPKTSQDFILSAKKTRKSRPEEQYCLICARNAAKYIMKRLLN